MKNIFFTSLRIACFNIAPNINISTIQFFEHYNERQNLLQENIIPDGSNRKRLHRKIESPERTGTEESRESRHNGNGNGSGNG